MMAGSTVRYLVLWLTTGCNLQCAYCYRGEQEPRSMPEDVARAALQLAAASGLPFHVQLAGGEPMLEPQLIAFVGETIRKAGWPATLAVQTNGTLLDRGMIGLCRRHGISLGISLDGPPGVQDQTRGNAVATFRGLHLLSRAGMPIRITSVLSSANVMHLGELILALAAFPNIEGIGLDPLVHKGKALEGGQTRLSNDAIRRGIRNMLESLRPVNRLRPAPIRWRELDAVQRAMSSETPPGVYCHACRGESLAVHPDGTVYPCSQTVGDDAMAVGTVERIDWPKLRGLFRDLRLHGDCHECPLEGRCPGDCPSRLMYNDAPAARAMCSIYRTIAEWSHEEKEVP